MANEHNEQDTLATLRTRMAEVGVTDVEIRKNVVFWNGIDIGAIPYLNSRRMDQLKGIGDRVKSQSTSSVEVTDED